MVYPFQTHLINRFVFIDCENGDIANTEKISNFLTKNKSKYLKEETKVLCFFGKNKTLDIWKSGVLEKIADLSNFEFIDTNENVDMIISAFFGVLYRDYPKAEFIIISHDNDYSSLANYFSGVKISISQQKICKQKSKKQNAKSENQKENPPTKNAANATKKTVAEKKTSKTEKKSSNRKTKTAAKKTQTEQETKNQKGKKQFDLESAKEIIMKISKTKRPKKIEKLKSWIASNFNSSDLDSDTNELLGSLKSDGKIEVDGEKNHLEKIKYEGV